ncbi:MAG: WD40 repeat domain-containing protein [Pseudolabrys sp.]
MTDAHSDTPSLTDRIRAVTASGTVVGAHFLGMTPVFVLGEEELLFAPQEAERRVKVHAGAILASAGDGARIITGGDDGTAVTTDAGGQHRLAGADPGRRWVDQVALGPDGAVVYGAGKIATVQTANGAARTWKAPSTVAGLAFAPKGFRLAVAHYNGVTLWFPNTQAVPEKLEWKGSHLAVAYSPDGKFLVTAMQEPTLHGWRLADTKHMRMSGYSARVRSTSWTADGKFLATSGFEQLILWPFDGKDGPMGKQPRLLAPGGARVAVVACHPQAPIVATGYSDGLILLVRIDDGAEILARRPGGAPVTALAWDPSGAQLAFGCEDGEAGIVAL